MGSWNSWEEESHPSSSSNPQEYMKKDETSWYQLTEQQTDQADTIVSRMVEKLSLSDDYLEKIDSAPYPQRDAQDCAFFLKTGACKFGLKCKFNHPLGMSRGKETEKGVVLEQNGVVRCKYFATPVGCKYGKACRYSHSDERQLEAPNALNLPAQSCVTEKETNGFVEKETNGFVEKETNGFVEKPGQIECKFHLTAEGCIYGKACIYRHSTAPIYVDKSKLPESNLNFLGLPIRPSMKECLFYMQSGACKFGAGCKFNHPEPTGSEGTPVGAVPVGGHPSQNWNTKSHPANLFGATEQSVEPWHSTIMPNVPYFNNYSSNPNGMHLSSPTSWYQDSRVAQENPAQAYRPAINNQMTTKAVASFDQQLILDEFPERPGEPECSYYLRTGDCKYRISCKFNHPKNQPSKSPETTLNSTGLPIRPGKNLCTYYAKFNICKFGSGCIYDHPDAIRNADGRRVVVL